MKRIRNDDFYESDQHDHNNNTPESQPKHITHDIPEQLLGKCVICLYGPPPEFDDVKPTWSMILQVVLYALRCLYPDTPYYSLHEHINSYLVDHWELIKCQKSKDSSWMQTVKMTLSRYSLIFENGYEEMTTRGYWRLKNHIDPYTVPIYKERERTKGVDICRFWKASAQPESSYVMNNTGYVQALFNELENLKSTYAIGNNIKGYYPSRLPMDEVSEREMAEYLCQASHNSRSLHHGGCPHQSPTTNHYFKEHYTNRAHHPSNHITLFSENDQQFEKMRDAKGIHYAKPPSPKDIVNKPLLPPSYLRDNTKHKVPSLSELNIPLEKKEKSPPRILNIPQSIAPPAVTLLVEKSYLVKKGSIDYITD
eukprot:TRINITY_DN530_c0_g1_i1.p1 TRINITY_DN530_c0_g1~~TRINITY_DN530_c0_g1_i1.p1  ORF type:complete len:377 (-),score=60.46 TRINITY_DN530_c0_g1_i1:708-1808(-)